MHKTETMKPYLIILYIILCIAVTALTDALNFLDFGTWAHTANAAGILLLISGPFIFKLERRHWVAYIVAFAFWRVVGFDYLFNLFAGLPWDYIGVVSFWDKVLSKVPPHGLIFIRAVFMIAAVAIPLQYMKSDK